MQAASRCANWIALISRFGCCRNRSDLLCRRRRGRWYYVYLLYQLWRDVSVCGCLGTTTSIGGVALAGAGSGGFLYSIGCRYNCLSCAPALAMQSTRLTWGQRPRVLWKTPSYTRYANFAKLHGAPFTFRLWCYVFSLVAPWPIPEEAEVEALLEEWVARVSWCSSAIIVDRWNAELVT